MVLAKDVTVNRTGNSLRHAAADKRLSSCKAPPVFLDTD